MRLHVRKQHFYRKQHTTFYSNNKYCICTQNVQSTRNHSKQDENGMKLKRLLKIGNTVNICDPSIANCRLLIAQQSLELRNVIGSVFCVNTKRGNSERYREFSAVLWKTCGLEWASVSKAENVLGVQQNWFGSWYIREYQVVHIVSDVSIDVLKKWWKTI